MPASPIRVGLVDGRIPLKSIEAWVFSFKLSIPSLAHIENVDGASTLYLNTEFAKVLGSWDGPTPIVSMLRGNEHASMMLNNLPAYDFVDPAVPELMKGVPIIDDVFIDQHIQNWIDAVFPSLLAIRQTARNPVIHVLPPPPRENPHLANYQEFLGKLVAQFGFVPDHLRLKWYRRYCHQLAIRLESIGCRVLPHPEEACTPDGLLKEEYAEGLTHGNGSYGALVAGKLLSTMELTP